MCKQQPGAADPKGWWYVVTTERPTVQCPKKHDPIALPLCEGRTAFRGDKYTVCSKCGGRFDAVAAPAQFEHCGWTHHPDGTADQKIITVTLKSFGDEMYEFTPTAEKANQAVVGEINKTHSNVNLNLGICRGICLDWIRRAVLADTPGSPALPATKMEKLAGRGAWAQALSNTDFGSFSHDMAKKHKDLKGKESRRPFTDVEEVRAPETRKRGPADCLASLLQDRLFVPSACALVVFKPSQAIVGHMIVIHRQNVPEVFHFFDPNFGAYNIVSREKLGEALAWLVSKKHNMSDPWMGYSIYRKAQHGSNASQLRPAAAGTHP
jgi:hypothetical protein